MPMPCFFSLLFSIHASIVSRLTPLLRNNLLRPRPLVVTPQTPLACWFVHHISSPHLNLNSSRYLILISLLSFFLYNCTKYWSLNSRIEISNICMWICEYPFASKAIYAYLTLSFCVYCYCILYSWPTDSTGSMTFGFCVVCLFSWGRVGLALCNWVIK